MNTLTKTGAVLAKDKIDRYKPKGAFGNPAYRSHVQLRAMLLKRGPQFANYFSRPILEPESGELRWISEVPGTPKAWLELSKDEIAKADKKLSEIKDGLDKLILELRAEGGKVPDGTGSAYSSILERAKEVPTEGRFLFCVGDQPMIAFWGFTDQSGRSVDPANVAPRFASLAAGGTMTPAVSDPNGAFPAAPGVSTPLKLQKANRPWWWWLLWLLLLLLLLLFLLAALRGCGTDGSFDVGKVLPGMAGVAPGGSEPKVPSDGGSGGPGARPDVARPESPTGNGTAPFDGQPVPGVAASNPAGASSAPASDGLSDDSRKSQDAGSLKADPSSNDKDTKKNVDPMNDKNPGVESDKKSQTNPPVPNGDSAPLEMPKDPKAAEKMAFLEGSWKAGDGLYDKKTNKPLDLAFRFGKDGKGEISVRRQDGSLCKGPVQGRMDGDKLSIDGSQSIPCAGGGSYAPQKIECAKNAMGQTQCYGINPDGSRYFMGVQRQP